MNLHCPVCHSKFTLDQASREQALLDLVELASRFGKSWNLVSEYVDCFRAGNWGTVNLAKRIRILRELAPLFERCEFAYDGKKYRTDPGRIRAAMTTVCNLEKWGFKNHNYLKKVLVADAEKLSAEGLTATEEQQIELQRRRPSNLKERSSAQPDTSAENRAISAKDFKQMKGLESLVGQIGKPMP